MVRAFVLTTLFALGWASSAEAGGCCCPSCGCRQVKKICVCVPDVKKETKFEYTAVCEDFCVPGPSRVVGRCHTKDCRGCDECRPVRQPTCAHVRTRVKLVKTPVTCETPTVKWIVKTVCSKCGACCGDHGDSCVEPGGKPCTTAVSASGEMPAVAQPGVPPPEVPLAVPAAYNGGSSTLVELLSTEAK